MGVSVLTGPLWSEKCLNLKFRFEDPKYIFKDSKCWKCRKVDVFVHHTLAFCSFQVLVVVITPPVKLE